MHWGAGRFILNIVGDCVEDTFVMRMTCRFCKTSLKISSAVAGKKVKCPSCAKVLLVPTPKPVPIARPAVLPHPAVDFAALAAKTSPPGPQDASPKKAPPRRGPLTNPAVWVIGGSLAVGLLLIAGLGIAMLVGRGPSEPQTVAKVDPESKPAVSAPAPPVTPKVEPKPEPKPEPQPEPEPKPDPVDEKPKEPAPVTEIPTEPMPAPPPPPPPEPAPRPIGK